jgi:hypothetical protein
MKWKTYSNQGFRKLLVFFRNSNVHALALLGLHINMMFLSVTQAVQDPLYMWQHRFVQLEDKRRLTQIRREKSLDLQPCWK